MPNQNSLQEYQATTTFRYKPMRAQLASSTRAKLKNLLPKFKIFDHSVYFSINNLSIILQNIYSFPIGIRAPAPWAPVSSSTRLGVRVVSSETSSAFPSPGADTQTRTRGEQTHSGVVIIYKM